MGWKLPIQTIQKPPADARAWLRTWYIGNIHLWLIVAMLAVGGILHYTSSLVFYSRNSPFGNVEHSMDRVLFMVPVIYGGFVFGPLGGFITLSVATLIMLPRVFFISASPVNELLEISSIVFVSSLVVIWFSGQKKEKERRQEALAKFETARQELASHIEIITKHERRLAAINEVGSLVSQDLELPRIFHRILDKVVEMMEVPVALILLKDKTGQKLELADHKGVSQDFVQAMANLSVGEGFNGRVALSGEPMIVENASEDSRLSVQQVRQEGIQSQLIVPLRSKGSTIGTLCVAVRSSRRFSTEDVELLAAIGSEVGIAITNARLYQEILAAKEKYQDLFENATVAIFVHGLDGVITAANNAWANLTGYSLPDLIGMNVSRLFPPNVLNIITELDQKLLQGDSMIMPLEVRMVRRDGAEIIVSLTNRLISENGQPSGFQHIATDVTERRRMRDTLNYYIRQILIVQEEERKRIARELHDETAQSLLLISQRLDGLTSDPHSNLPGETRTYLEGVRVVVVKTLNNLRHLTQDLRPRILDDLGLVAALEWLADDLEKHTGLKVRVKVAGPQKPLRPEAQLLLFRIAQEALSNVRRHAEATLVDIVLEHGQERVRLTIRDNGKGFHAPVNVADLAAEGKLGILGMYERARLLNGTVSVSSELGKGTIVVASLPI